MAFPRGMRSPIELTIGEPREAMPEFIVDKLTEAAALYGKYPPIRGTDELKGAIAAWLSRRYAIPGGVDPAREILPLNGSREGLFFACLPAVGRKRVKGQPVIQMCNPYYSAYIAGALGVGAKPVFLNATASNGFPPGPRRDGERQGAPRAHRGAVHLLAGQSARRGCVARLHKQGVGAGPRARFSAVPR